MIKARALVGHLKKVRDVALARHPAGRQMTVYPDDLFIVSYPRSGNTWTRFLIGNLIYQDEPVTFANVEDRIPSIYIFSDRKLRRLPRVLKSHDCFDPRYPSDLDVLHREPLKTAFANMPIQIEALKKQLGDAKDPAQRATIEKQLAATQADLEELKKLKPTPPTATYSSKMTIYRGQREIQLLFLGRGHTQGDTVVFLPKERIVCTGDLMESRLAYMGDAMFDEWITTLETLKNLDFDTVLPGHGVPFHEKSLITAYQSYLKDLIVKVAELRKQGLSVEETAQKVDLTSHKADFPQIQGPGADVRGVRRMYEWMDERAKR